MDNFNPKKTENLTIRELVAVNKVITREMIKRLKHLDESLKGIQEIKEAEKKLQQ